jgi:hypothetical protein
MPTVMSDAMPEELLRKLGRRQPSGWRWVGGPMVALLVAFATAAIAQAVLPLPRALPHNRGRLRLETDPPGAQVLVDGRTQPRATPTEVEGEVGATLRVSFRLPGYVAKDADVYVGEGEHPFRAKLEREQPEPATAEPQAAPKGDAPVVLPPPVVAKQPRHPLGARHGTKLLPTQPEPSATGTGFLSVFVHPWAIVFVDGTRLRQTPLEGFELPAGRHMVELVNDGQKRKERVGVVIRAGDTEEIRRE